MIVATLPERAASSKFLETQWRRVIWNVNLEDIGSERHVDVDLGEAQRQVRRRTLRRSRAKADDRRVP